MRLVVMVGTLFCLSGILNGSFAAGITEYQKAQQYLLDKKEVYFSFQCESPIILSKLKPIISIDNYSGIRIFAYANSEAFETFLTYNLDYLVETHPADLLKEIPTLSDYEDIHNHQFDKYPTTYTAFLNILKQFETDYPKLCKTYEIGKSFNGKSIMTVKVSSDVSEHKMKPLFYGTGSMHGDETLGFMLCLQIIDFLMKNYGQDPKATRIVDSIELWITPLQNPDGVFNKPGDAFGNQIRANAQGFDLNRNCPDPRNGNPSTFATEMILFLDFEKKYNFVSSFDLHGGAEAIYTAWYCWSRAPADKAWYDLVVKEFVDTVHKVSPSSYLKGFHGQGYSAWGELHGTRCDYQPYFRHCRELCCELNQTKTLSESLLKAHWDYSKNSLLNFILQTLNGIRGVITDSVSGKGITAKVFVEKHDIDSSWVYSNEPYGDYYRLIAEGTYDVTFSNSNYHSKTVTGVKVKNNAATICNVQLSPLVTANNAFVKKLFPIVSIISSKAGILIQ